MNCILYIIPLSWKKENVVRQIYKNLKLDIDISILQSVSIKTIGGYNTNTMKKTFILHFATINTDGKTTCNKVGTVFTIHFATINTFCHRSLSAPIQDLQYTLILLIHMEIKY